MISPSEDDGDDGGDDGGEDGGTEGWVDDATVDCVELGGVELGRVLSSVSCSFFRFDATLEADSLLFDAAFDAAPIVELAGTTAAVFAVRRTDNTGGAVFAVGRTGSTGGRSLGAGNTGTRTGALTGKTDSCCKGLQALVSVEFSIVGP